MYEYYWLTFSTVCYPRKLQFKACVFHYITVTASVTGQTLSTFQVKASTNLIMSLISPHRLSWSFSAKTEQTISHSSASIFFFYEHWNFWITVWNFSELLCNHRGFIKLPQLFEIKSKPFFEKTFDNLIWRFSALECNWKYLSFMSDHKNQSPTLLITLMANDGC